MSKLIRWTSELNGNLRLIFVALGGAVAAFAWCVRRGEGSVREHLQEAAVIGLAPLCLAFPRLFRQRRRGDTLAQLRAAGVI